MTEKDPFAETFPSGRILITDQVQKLSNSKCNIVGFEILTSTTAKNAVLRDVTPCIAIEVRLRAGGTYCLHRGSKGKQIKQPGNRSIRLCWLFAYFWLLS
jgi:hypothetical protein